MNIGSLLSHAANFGVAASTAASLSDRLAGKKKGKRTVKRAAKNPFTGQIEIPQEILDRFGEDYINAIFDAENVPEYLTALSDAALAENDYWSYNDFQTLLGLVRVAEAREALDKEENGKHRHFYNVFFNKNLVGSVLASGAADAQTKAVARFGKGAVISKQNPFFTDEDVHYAKAVKTTGYCVGCQVQYGNTEGVVTQSFRDSEGVQWFEVKPQRGSKIAVPASDVRIMHNPSYRVHLEVPAVRESVDVSAITQGGAFRKGKRQLRSHLKTHPKWSVERNPEIDAIGQSETGDEGERRAYYLEAMNHLGYGDSFITIHGLVCGRYGEGFWVGRRAIGSGIDFSGSRREVADYLAALPLPESNPLHHGARHASENIRELHHGPQYARTMRKYGKGVAHRQAIAAGLHAAGVSQNPISGLWKVEAHTQYGWEAIYFDADNEQDALTKGREQFKLLNREVYDIVADDIVQLYLPQLANTEENPSGKGKRKSLPVALVLNPDETLQKLYDKYNKADDEFNRVVDNYSPTDKSYSEKVNRALHKRQKLLTNIQRYRQKHQKRNGAEIHPSVKSKLNAISEEFHGPNNHMKGRASHHYISDHVKARNFSRAGSATVIKLVNDATGEHSAPDHWCEECALFPNPKTSVLGISTGKHVQLMGNGVHALGKRIKRNLDRMDEAELAEIGVKRERGGGYDLGKADTQVYTCVEKWADVDDNPDLINYYHEWAEETRELEDKPNAKIDENGMIYLSGGKHTVTKAGIEN